MRRRDRTALFTAHGRRTMIGSIEDPGPNLRAINAIHEALGCSCKTPTPCPIHGPKHILDSEIPTWLLNKVKRKLAGDPEALAFAELTLQQAKGFAEDRGV